MPQKLKRKNQQALLPMKLLSSLEQSDKQASTKRRKQFTTHTLPKSLATKSQYQIQTNLIECRILLQRVLTNSNNGGGRNEDEFGGNPAKGLDKLLDKLVDARNTLCDHTLQNESTDDEDENKDEFQKDYNKLKIQWKHILNRHYDNMNITKRYNKKDSNSKFFQVVDQSFWTQVENTVQHSALLEQHSQIKLRDEEEDSIDDGKPNSAPSLVFDDTKIYQHMLQEYITLSTERTESNATSLAEHRLKLASSTNKNKNDQKDIDRRASKGRKIRYVVHEKLKNFTFPLQREVNSKNNHVIMEDDVLFKSMMGGVLTNKKKSRR